jgi:phosphatidylglycerophosphate synthase
MNMTSTTPSQKKDLDPVVQGLRKLSVRVADVAFRLHLRPNHITLFRFCFLGGLAAACLVVGGYLFNFLALILLAAGFFFDLVDGDLARRHNMRSHYGAELEVNLDAILLSLLLLAISCHAFLSHTGLEFVGLIGLFSQIFSTYYTNLYKMRFNIDCVESNPLMEELRAKKSISAVERFIIELLAPKHIIYSLFSNFRYYLVIGVLINQLVITFLIFAIMLSIRWISLAITVIAYGKHQDRPSQYEFFSVLSKLDRNNS